MEYKGFKSAVAFMNKDFIRVIACSGYRMKIEDPQATEFFLSLTVTDKELGETVLKSLEESRILTPEESYEISSITEKDYPLWVERTMKRFGYKTKGAMFRRMLSCSMNLQNETQILFKPSYQCSIDGWSGDFMKESDRILIPLNSSPEEIGAALRLTFTRCKSKY